MTRSHRAPERRPSATGTVLRAVEGVAIVVALTFAAEGCGRSAAAESPPPTAVVTLVTEDIATVERRDLATGPILTGTLTARRHATVRAEVGGAVTAVYADEGNAYAPKEGLKQATLSTSLGYLLTPRTSLMGFAMGTRLGKEAAASPMARQRNGLVAGVGIAFGI